MKMIMKNKISLDISLQKILLLLGILFFSYSLFISPINAATLKAFPSTGVYTVGSPFSVSVVLNTAGKSVNAADGQLSFNPRELQVVSVSRSSSIFNLWTQEPTFSNSAGTISFGGGSPMGYKGSNGTVFRIVFRPLGAGTPKVTFKSGSVLAADGLGTNILTTMNGGSYTISAVTNEPEPEYIPPANTPSAPKVSSLTHPDPEGWSKETTATFTWSIPSGVTTVRMLLSDSPGTVPTKVYDTLITEKTIEELDQGESYFHIQFKNSDGWGRITHYRIGVDSKPPQNLTLTVEDSTDINLPGHILKFTYDDISPVSRYLIKVDGNEPVEYVDEDGDGQILLHTLQPGNHSIVAEVYDAAGNLSVVSHSFDVQAFEKPIFTEYPSRINTEVIPAIKGTTRPDADVSVSVVKDSSGIAVFADSGSDDIQFNVKANADGEFTYIPPASFEPGVYTVTAIARDAAGKLSERSDEIKIVVEVPGYIVFGTMAINILSVIIPVAALLILLIFGLWYMWHKFNVWRGKVKKETREAIESLASEFGNMVTNLNESVAMLTKARKGKLTKAEKELIAQMKKDLKVAQTRITKEVGDIDELVKK